MTSTALVLGVGQIGRAVALNLIAHGWSVTVAHRPDSTTPPELLKAGVRVHAFDRDDDHAFAGALASGYDAAVDTVAYHEAHAQQWIAARGAVERLAVISTGSVYADAAGRTLDEADTTGFPRYPVPIGETQTRARPGPETYSTRKVAMEDALLAAFDDGLTILRPFAVHGPGSRSPREWWFLARFLAGVRTVPLPYNGESRFHTSAAANIAELARVGLKAPGVHILNSADPEALTVAEIGQAIAQALDWTVSFQPVAGPAAAPADSTPWSVPRPLVADLSAATALGYRPVTDYRRAAPETCRALLAAAAERGWREAFPGLAPYPREMFEV